MATTSSKSNYGPVAGFLTAIGAIFLKFKLAIFGIFKALPLLKLGWLLKSFGTMFLSLAAYTALFGWRYAVTLVGLIYVHEMGHFMFMKAKGLNPKAPVFLPFIGAYTAMSNLPGDPITHAMVAYAGPLVGGLSAVALYYFGLTTHNLYLVAASSTGFLLNLFQLLPVRPFDGGFMASCISKWLAIPGVIALIAFSLFFHSPVLIIISVVAVFRLIPMLRTQTPVEVSTADRLMVTVLYFGLSGLLGWFYWASEQQLHLLTAGHRLGV